MKNVLVITSLKKDERIKEVMAAEFQMTDKWREQGVIEHLFGKENGGGAVVVFNEADVEKVRNLMSQLPLFPFFEHLEYLTLDKLY